jgi:ribonuclease P protein component
MVQGRWLRMSSLPRPGAAPLRVGIVTSRRVGGAVQRNRLRRRLREIFRARRHDLADGVWMVVTAKPGSALATFAELREEWLRLAKRLSILRDL